MQDLFREKHSVNPTPAALCLYFLGQRAGIWFLVAKASWGGGITKICFPCLSFKAQVYVPGSLSGNPGRNQWQREMGSLAAVHLGPPGMTFVKTPVHYHHHFLIAYALASSLNQTHENLYCGVQVSKLKTEIFLIGWIISSTPKRCPHLVPGTCEYYFIILFWVFI